MFCPSWLKFVLWSLLCAHSTHSCISLDIESIQAISKQGLSGCQKQHRATYRAATVEPAVGPYFEVCFIQTEKGRQAHTHVAHAPHLRTRLVRHLVDNLHVRTAGVRSTRRQHDLGPLLRSQRRSGVDGPRHGAPRHHQQQRLQLACGRPPIASVGGDVWWFVWFAAAAVAAETPHALSLVLRV